MPEKKSKPASFSKSSKSGARNRSYIPSKHRYTSVKRHRNSYPALSARVCSSDWVSFTYHGPGQSETLILHRLAEKRPTASGRPRIAPGRTEEDCSIQTAYITQGHTASICPDMHNVHMPSSAIAMISTKPEPKHTDAHETERLK